MRTMFAGGTLAADLSGSGTPLVLFHSLLADSSSFARVTGALAARFQVVLPNLPGFPGSAPVTGGLADIADRMAELVGELGPAPMVLGNGYGGFVALLMALRHPGLVARLVLADAGAAFSEPGREAFRGMARAASAKGLDAIADVAMRRLFAPAFHAENPSLVADRRARFLQTDPAIFMAACGELAALDLRQMVPDLQTKVLVLVGEQDEATPPAMSHELAGLLPHSELIVLPGCAHVPQLQAPERFLAAVLPFLTEIA